MWRGELHADLCKTHSPDEFTYSSPKMKQKSVRMVKMTVNALKLARNAIVQMWFDGEWQDPPVELRAQFISMNQFELES